MDIKRKITSLIDDICNGRFEVGDRIDGVFVGSKKKLIDSILFSKKASYMAVVSFPLAIPQDANRLIENTPPIGVFGEAGYIFKITSDTVKSVAKFTASLESIDSIYVFTEEFGLMFYANDDLEDVTITLKMLSLV